jgi:hypothetical protein
VKVDGPAIARPGSTGQARRVDPEVGALAQHYGAQALREHRRRLRVVLGGVGDAEPTAEVELGQAATELGQKERVQAEHAPRGDLEAGRVEDL